MTEIERGEVAPTSTARAAVGMGAVTAVSRALGFVRVLMVAAVLGTTFLGNAFQSANSVSNVLFELLAAGALSAVLVPTFVERIDAGDQRGAEEVAGGVLGVALLGLGAITAVGVVMAPWLARLLTVGVPESVAADQRELVAYLLRFFLPQLMLYAAGTVAIAVLYARRRFAVTAAAPIGNTVVMVACLAVFAVVAGDDPGLDLSQGERLLLVAAGTGGVIAFVGILLVACERAGFRLQASSATRRRTGQRRAPSLRLGRGAAHRGRPLAWARRSSRAPRSRAEWSPTRSPGSSSSRPTACWPNPSTPRSSLSSSTKPATPTAFSRSVRWALERMALLVVPVSAGMVALAGPGMRVVSFGETSTSRRRAPRGSAGWAGRRPASLQCLPPARPRLVRPG